MSDSYNRERTVMVVADRTEVTNLVELWLAGDYDVRKAVGGAEAVDRFDESVDLVVLHRSLPDVTDDEVVAELGNEGYSGAVVTVSGLDPEYDPPEYEHDRCLRKPVDMDELRETIAAVIGPQTRGSATD